jgi:hypothetical protein
VSGVVGNGGLMFIICFYKSMRNLPNLFVFNLALGDLFVRLLFSVPFTTSIYMFDSWPFGELVRVGLQSFRVCQGIPTF